METDETIRAVRFGSQFRDRQARCVGGEDRLPRTQSAEFAEQRVLRSEVLGDRLDDEVARRQVRQVERRVKTSHRRVPVRRTELLLVHGAVEVFSDPGHPPVEEPLLHIPHDRLITGRRADLRDPAPHQSRSDDPDLPNLSQCPLPPYPFACCVSVCVSARESRARQRRSFRCHGSSALRRFSPRSSRSRRP